MKRIITIILLIILVTVIPRITVSASESEVSPTYTISSDGEFIRTNEAYRTNQYRSDLGLRAPNDLYFDKNDNLYIADTDYIDLDDDQISGRILIYDISTQTVKDELKYVDFVSPTGVFVSDDLDIYVADPGASKIFIFDKDFNLKSEIGKPDSIAYDLDIFKPTSIAADKSGNIFVLVEGGYGGIAQLSNSGEFIGYFSSNNVLFSNSELIRKFFYDFVGKDFNVVKTPPPFSNLFIDSDSIVYSTTASSSSSQRIKKHNTQGHDTLNNTLSSSELTDIYVDSGGIIYTSSATGVITTYSRYGEYIFHFGAGNSLDGDIVGVYSDLRSIAVSSEGEIFTIDNAKSYLLSYTQTDYSKLIYEGLRLFDEGHYDESTDVWNEVLTHNQMSKIAYDQLGKTYMFRQDYLSAMENLELSKNREFYSQAYWEIRNEQIRSGLPIVFSIGLIIGVIYIALKITNKRTDFIVNKVDKVKKKLEYKHIQEFMFLGKIIKNPSDGFYQIRKEKINGLVVPTIFVLFGFIAYVLNVTSKGFLFQIVDIEDINILSLVLGYFMIFGGFVFTNYLVTSITDGIGGLKKIYISTAYALVPYAVALVLSTIFSHFATLDEAFFVSFIVFLGIAWTLLLIFVGSTIIQNYDASVTLKSFMFTFLLMIILIVIALFLQLMMVNIMDFLLNVLLEVIRVVF